MKRLSLIAFAFALFASLSAFAADPVTYTCENQGDGYVSTVAITVVSEKEVVFHIPVWGLSPTYMRVSQEGNYSLFGDGVKKPLFMLPKDFPAQPVLRLDWDAYYGQDTGTPDWHDYLCAKSSS